MPDLNPNDAGLSETAICTRRRSHRLARLMLITAALTAVAGWALFGTSIFSAIHIKEQSPYRAIIAYALLIVSSATLVLGFWYLLLAQVQRIAHIVESEESLTAPERPLCPNCGWPRDPPDRFCRHCGKGLAKE
ncbi:MAG: zinc ribbon domain-containing protein [Phycisphaerales bacterium]|nr:zinc ribbon domain-containing protein [Phycisphaerales bacterium]